MVKSLIKQISDALHERFENIYSDDMFFNHYGLGMFIRNNFLWQSPKNCEILFDFFHSEDVDSLSSDILEYIKKNNL